MKTKIVKRVENLLTGEIIESSTLSIRKMKKMLHLDGTPFSKMKAYAIVKIKENKND